MTKRTQKNITTLGEPALFSRPDLARRWQCCIETIKRLEKGNKKGNKLQSITIGPRLKRYRLEDVLAFESAA
ncbi:MAG: hypothetical protein ABMA01_18225 [Chthoniobacteraceae bacterium]